MTKKPVSLRNQNSAGTLKRKTRSQRTHFPSAAASQSCPELQPWVWIRQMWELLTLLVISPDGPGLHAVWLCGHLPLRVLHPGLHDGCWPADPDLGAQVHLWTDHPFLHRPRVHRLCESGIVPYKWGGAHYNSQVHCCCELLIIGCSRARAG